MTFSITATDPHEHQFGIAVSTAVPAVGALVPHVSARGAVATQSYVNFDLAPHGLAALEANVPLQAALESLLEQDEGHIWRQVAAVDALGTCWAYTGSDCVDWAGHRVGREHVVAGNMLVGEETLVNMDESYKASAGKEFAVRLLEALVAGQAAGGDKRGRQSAALLIASPHPAFYHNLRVDDHPDPVSELLRIFQVTRESMEARSRRYDDLKAQIKVKW